MRHEQRQQLETDALILRTEQAIAWSRENRRTLVTVVAGAAGLALLIGGLAVNRGNRREAARNQLATLTSDIQQAPGGEAGQLEICQTSLPDLVQLAESEGNSTEGRTARFYVGVCQRAIGDLEAAAASFQAVSERGGDLLADQATRSLAGVQHRSGMTDEAADTYQRLLDAEPRFPLDPVLFELAVLEEERGDSAAARALYDRLAVEYPASGFSDLAAARRERLPELVE